MKQSISFLLIFLILLNSTSFGVAKLVFSSQKQYFINNFCVNKSKPKLQCEGKCHLKKVYNKIGKANGTEQNSIKLSINFEFIASEIESFKSSIAQIANLDFKRKNIFYIFSFYKELIKPPVLS